MELSFWLTNSFGDIHALLIIACDLLNQQHPALVKRDTTLDNVKAMYNRFVSESRGKVSFTYISNDSCSLSFCSCFILAVYKYGYNISMYHARKPREANEAYVKDYLKDS